MEFSQQNSAMKFYSVLLDTLPEAITMVNRDGTVLEWNQAAEKIYAIPRETIVGRPISEFFRRSSLMLIQVMESGLPVYGVYHQPRPDKHVFIHTVPITNEDGELIGAISIEQDMTDIVKLSEERYSQQTSQEGQDLPIAFDTSNRYLKKELVFIETILQTEPLGCLLMTGESGVGKSMLAKYMHTRSLQTGSFVSLSCDAYPEGLLDIELFGHQEHDYSAKLETASQGTLYLRNINQMAQKTQVKLAQAIRDNGFYKNRGQAWIPLTCRIVASVGSVDSEPTPDIGIDKDLYFAFHVIDIPPLRDRREDLPQLCRAYLSQSAKRLGKPVPHLSSEVMAAFATYPWPGNIVEFQRVIEHLIIVAGDEPLRLADLPKALRPQTVTDITNSTIPLSALSEEMERQKIQHALVQTDGNKSSAAKLLGISRGALYYKLRQYDLAFDLRSSRGN